MNSSDITFDVYRFAFETNGTLKPINQYSGPVYKLLATLLCKSLAL